MTRLESFGRDTPRRLKALGEGYTLFVRVAKFTLPVAALIILGLLFTNLSEDPQQQIVAEIPKKEETSAGQVELLRAKYEGVDSQGRAYTLTADKAERALDAPDTVLLAKPLADITLEDETWLAIKADQGSFDSKTSMLVLKENVHIFHDGGYELHLEEATVDLAAKSAVSEKTVHVQSPVGTLQSSGMKVLDQGNMIIFGGPVKIVLTHFSAAGG